MMTIRGTTDYSKTKKSWNFWIKIFYYRNNSKLKKMWLHVQSKVLLAYLWGNGCISSLLSKKKMDTPQKPYNYWKKKKSNR